MKKIPKRTKQLSPETDSIMEQGPEKPNRFPTMSSLLSKYGRDILGKRDQAQNERIWLEYDQRPYTDGGRLQANFGQLRFKVGKAITTYVDYVTERQTWFKISTYEGEENQQLLWNEYITAAFHRFCIKPWKARVPTLMLAIQDMILFTHGVLRWPKPYCCYPEHTNVLHVWPNGESGICPESFDVCHIQVRWTAQELFTATNADRSGKWNKEAVLDLINSGLSSKQYTHDTLWQKLSGRSADSSITDQVFDLVVSLVKEFNPEGERVISSYIFPAGGAPKTKSMAKKEDQDDKFGYLYYSNREAECMSQRLVVLSHTIREKFYEDNSFASMLYPVATVHNRSMNRILEAAEDSMRVFLRSESPEAYKKIATMRFGGFNLMPTGITLEQDRIQRPIADALTAVRTLTMETNAAIGHYEINASAQNGGTKTATQSNLDASESASIASSALRLFNWSTTGMGIETYRRFTTCLKEHSEAWKNFERFKRYLRKKNVPDAAWDPENVDVEPVSSVGAGSSAQKLQAAGTIETALATPARSPGQKAAKRLAIAAVAGIENVGMFLPDDTDTAIPEDSRIGLENDALGQPGANPQNILVQQHDLHLRHIPSHIEDAHASMAMAATIVQNLEAIPDKDRGAYLLKVQDILAGVDNKLAHAQAHIQLASSTQNKATKGELTQYAQQINSLNKAQDDIQSQVNKAIEERAGGQESDQAAELSHKAKMFQMEEAHTKQLLDLKMQQAQDKGEQLRQNSAMNADHKMNLETAKAYHQAQLKDIEAQQKLRSPKPKP